MHATHATPVNSCRVAPRGMQRWLGPALKELRAGRATQQDIVDHMRGQGHKTAQSTVHRWEAAEVWPEYLADTMAAYAEKTGRAELEFWELALARWRADDALRRRAGEGAPAPVDELGRRVQAQMPTPQDLPQPDSRPGQGATASSDE